MFYHCSSLFDFNKGKAWKIFICSCTFDIFQIKVRKNIEKQNKKRRRTLYEYVNLKHIAVDLKLHIPFTERVTVTLQTLQVTCLHGIQLNNK